MNIEDVIKNMISNAEETPAAKETEKDFPEFMEGVLKELFGDQVSFKKVKEVDDGKNDIHIDIKCPNDPDKDVDKYMPKKEWDDDEKEIMNVVTEDEVEQVKHLVRKIAQQHKKELPLEGIYSAVAARLAEESDKLLRNKEKARQKALKAAMLKEQTQRKLDDFFGSLSEDEEKALKDILKEK